MASSSQVPFRKLKAAAVGLPLSRQNVVFATLQKRVICCQGSTILVLDSSNGSIIRRLTGHTSDVNQICLHKSNQLQLLSCSRDQTVRLWAYEDGKCLATWHLQANVVSISMSASLPDQALISISAHKSRKRKSDWIARHPRKRTVMLINVNGDRNTKEGGPTTQRFVCRLNTLCMLPPILHGSCAIMVAEKELLIWDVRQPTIKSVKLSVQATALAAHPVESYIVVGDKNGKIHFWYCLQQCVHDEKVEIYKGAIKKIPHPTAECTAVEHWHAHAVGSLAISNDGGDMFSGGEEGVLVQWQLQSHKKDFLPRLLAPIDGISLSEDGMLCALSCPDNSVRLLSLSTMKEQWRIRGLALACHEEQSPMQKSVVRTKLIFDPTSNALVVNDIVGSGKLQFYDVTRDQHLISLRLLPRNLISRMGRAPMHNLVVDWMAFAADGSSLATVDRLSGARSLKFWSCVYRTDASKVAKHFKLDCIVDYPHDDEITGLLYHPKRHLVVTLSADQTCKLWGRRDATDASKTTPAIGSKQTQRRVWHCRAICSYHNHACNAGAFSHDGSILALVFGATTTLWDPFTNTLLHTLVHHPKDFVNTVSFLANSAYLVTGSFGRNVVVWDLLTLQVWWAHSLDVQAMAIHPQLTRIVVAVKACTKPQKRKRDNKSDNKSNNKLSLRSTDTYLLTFDATTRVPLSYSVLPVPEVTDLAYPPSDNGETNSLLVADGEGMLHLVTGKKVGKARSQNPNKASQAAQTFKDIFNVPAAVAGARPSVSSAPSVLASGDSFDKMLQAPSHILPPPSLMFRVFLKDMQKSQADNQSSDSKKASTSSPSAPSPPTTVTKTIPKSSEIPISEISIKPADLAAMVSTDTRLGSFAELGRLFQEASGAAGTRNDRKKTVKSKGRQTEKAAATATATTANQTPQTKKQTPQTKKQTPQTKKETPKTKKETPQTKKQTPQTKKQTPQTKKQSPKPKEQTPKTKKETPKTKEQTPKTKKQTPQTKKETPKTKKETPKTKKQTPQTKKQTAETKKETPQSKKKTPQTKEETPQTKKQTPEIKKQTPQVRRSTRKRTARVIGNQNTESTRKVKDTKKKSDGAKTKTITKAVKKNNEKKTLVSSTPMKTTKASKAKSTIKKKKQTLQTPKSRVKTRSSSRYSLRKK